MTWKARMDAGASMDAPQPRAEGTAWGVARDVLALVLAAGVVLIVAAFGIGE